MRLEELNFTLPEFLSLLGVIQVVYILVYMAFRAGDIKRALLPALYFLVIGAAFFLDFAESFIGQAVSGYETWQWLLWFSGPPVSVLLILQIARIKATPSLINYLILLLIPASWLSAGMFTALDPDCTVVSQCEVYYDWLILMGIFAGTISLLTIWGHRGLFQVMHGEKAGRDRYWLVLSLIFLNILFLAVMFTGLTPVMSIEQAHLARTIVGLGFVYIAGTSLFRIYPQAVATRKKPKRKTLSRAETALAKTIEDLFAYEKIYQEPEYSRADLARELGTSETVVSRIINDYFQKSLPQLLNEHRVEDAKRLLTETDAPVKIIAGEVGFNSTTSFNRAFRDLTNTTPSRFRKQATGT